MNSVKTEEIEYKEALPDINEYWDLFITTGWNNRYKFTKSDLQIAIKNSWYAISVYKKERLIGFGRVISDGIHHAFIVDMIINPEHQGKGIGGLLLDKLLNKCLNNNIRDIQLFSAEDKYRFYEKYNFKRRAENAPGMQYRCDAVPEEDIASSVDG
jgi:ribosomal protein S18 acetylase RimI-like enzyme